MKMRQLMGSLAVLVAGFAASTAEADTRRYPIPGGGAMVLAVPDAWRDEAKRNYYPRRPVTIVFTPATGEEFVVHVSPVLTDARIPRPGPGEVHDGVGKSADALKSQSVEPELKIVDFRAGETYGSYYAATARSPKPDEYKHLTQGTFVLADLVVNFSIYTREVRDGIVEKTLDIMKAARREMR
ncbi:MAG TPA: hypothetical protein VM051_07535 [Usitatibacter sp.]|nr:hypothetical protein [Usitatibacter sp.]